MDNVHQPLVDLPPVPARAKKLCWPSAEVPPPDALDLASRYGAFEGPNYMPSDEWKELIKVADLCLSKSLAHKTIKDTTDTPMPQRAFVGKLVKVLKLDLPPKTVKTLTAIALAHDFPESTGLVALAIGFKEAAKFGGMLSIRTGWVYPTEGSGGILVDERTSWLGLV